MLRQTSHWAADSSVPIFESTVGSVLRDAAEAAPHQLAIVAYGSDLDSRRTWTFAELLRDAERTARAMLERFEPGEHIAVWANNVPEWLLLEFGAALAKLVLVTLNPALRAREVEYVLEQSGTVGLFHVSSFRGNSMAEIVGQIRPQLPMLRETIQIEQFGQFLACGSEDMALPHVSPDDPAQIQYTSGTTGFPKGAMLLHRAITNNARLAFEGYGVSQPTAYAHGMPFFHTAGCVLATLGPLQARVPQIFSEAFDAGLLLGMAERERASHLTGVPTMLIAMLQHPSFGTRDLSSVRVVPTGGAMVPPELVRAVETRIGAKVSIVFGQTEASPMITQVPPDASEDDKARTVGLPLPQIEVKIIDPANGAILPVGVVGEFCARGYMVMRGYHGMPSQTAEAIDSEGWLHTGDLATMDARGYCRIAGRLKDMVIRGGENLFPAEIEAVLHEHPAIVEAAVVGVADAFMGEELAAFVRTERTWSFDEAELRSFVRARLAPQKTPRYWIAVDEFPLTGSGKIQKFVLRERWQKTQSARAGD